MKVYEEYDRVNSLEGSRIEQHIYIHTYILYTYKGTTWLTHNSQPDCVISTRLLDILHTLPCQPVEHRSSLDSCQAWPAKSVASGNFGVIDSARNVVFVMSWALYAS